MPIYAGINGVVRKLKEWPVGIDGIVRQQKEVWAGVDGVSRKIFELEEKNVNITGNGMSPNMYISTKVVVNNVDTYTEPISISVKPGDRIRFTVRGQNQYNNGAIQVNGSYLGDSFYDTDMGTYSFSHMITCTENTNLTINLSSSWGGSVYVGIITVTGSI